MPDVAAEWWIHQENRTPIGPLTTDEVLRRITAGSVRMPFRRFFVAAFAGKFLRGILLAYLGYNLPFV